MPRPRPILPSDESAPRKKAPQGGSSPAGSVRIIGGHLRGRVMPYNGDPMTRPMKDRVREAIFNLIGPDVKGKHAFDLFAGTGVVGFEAISRGAARATMLERHFPTARSIKDNAAMLGIQDQVEVAAGDSFVWVKRFKEPGPLPWLVFCCPPYSLYVVRQDDQIDMIDRLLRMAPPGSIFIVESDERFDPALLPDAENWDVRSYPPTIVAVYRKGPDRSADIA